mmetsp:Transcript_81592/g.195724  ORF Transcript_81592/g.195724 Transcript_81592/m.195724 type:complete len:205 (-) Transcript_81592:159-773(-)
MTGHQVVRQSCDGVILRAAHGAGGDGLVGSLPVASALHAHLDVLTRAPCVQEEHGRCNTLRPELHKGLQAHIAGRPGVDPLAPVPRHVLLRHLLHAVGADLQRIGTCQGVWLQIPAEPLPVAATVLAAHPRCRALLGAVKAEIFLLQHQLTPLTGDVPKLTFPPGMTLVILSVHMLLALLALDLALRAVLLLVHFQALVHGLQA